MSRLLKILGLASIFTAFNANAGLTTAKGTYDIALEYEYADGKSGTFKSFEVDNEFGITDNMSVGANFWVEKQTDQKTFSYYEFFHKIGYSPASGFDFAARNLIRFYQERDGETKTHYELRLYAKHSTTSGLYQSSMLETSYRRRFSGQDSDALIINLYANFRITEKISFINKFQNNILLSSGRDDPAYGVTSYSLSDGVKVAETILYTGLGFSLPKNSYLYVQYRRDLGGKLDNSYNGIFIGISTSIDL